MRNDYRLGRRQVSFVVDEGLWCAVKAAAVAGGVSVRVFVTGLLEDAVAGGGVGAVVGGDEGLTGAERLAAIVAASRPVDALIAVLDECDPLEEIA